VPTRYDDVAAAFLDARLSSLRIGSLLPIDPNAAGARLRSASECVGSLESADVRRRLRLCPCRAKP